MKAANHELKQQAMRGLYAVTPDETDTTILLTKVEAALAGGTRLVQYRNKLADATLARIQATALAEMCQRYSMPLIINDDVHLAMEVGAQGVHIGKSDGSVAEARALLGSDSIIGVSCYNQLALANAAQQDGADYIAFGACFPSSTKPEAVTAGLELFVAAKELKLPMVAIGGISLGNAASVIAAGADALAVIGALWNSADIYQTALEFSRLFNRA